MAITIVLSENYQVVQYNEATSLYFEDESADYVYLRNSLFKAIFNETGKLIDLYDNEIFEGKELDKIKKLVEFQLFEISNMQVKKFKIHIHTQLHPKKEEIYKTLRKKDLEKKLQKLLLIIRLAMENNEKIVCLGD